MWEAGGYFTEDIDTMTEAQNGKPLPADVLRLVLLPLDPAARVELFHPAYVKQIHFSFLFIRFCIKESLVTQFQI